MATLWFHSLSPHTACEPEDRFLALMQAIPLAQPGDIVLYKKWEAYELTYEGVKYVVFDDNKDHMLAIFD